MKKFKGLLIILTALLIILFICACDGSGQNTPIPDQGTGDIPQGESYTLRITNRSPMVLGVGDKCQLLVNTDDADILATLEWVVEGDAVSVDSGGLVRAIKPGVVVVRVSALVANTAQSDSVDITVTESYGNTDEGFDEIATTIPSDTPEHELPSADPYEGMDASEFYENYSPAENYLDAYYRSLHGFMSGSLDVPDQMHTVAHNRPKADGMLVKNTQMYYIDGGNTYIVLDSDGNVALRIHKGGAYITLEEVAAYMYAFGGSSSSLPANYVSKKSGKPTNSIWGEYLRLNHSYFSGNTYDYPYEPVLPNIKGMGGALQYYEMDIGTTGTRTPSQNTGAYNNGYTIKRGAARLVYGRADLNRNGEWDEGELYVFYTYNHYNDFTEYLNYYNGWGEVFGNTTGGGVFDSETMYNPTPYVPTYNAALFIASPTVYIIYDTKKIRHSGVVHIFRNRQKQRECSVQEYSRCF